MVFILALREVMLFVSELGISVSPSTFFLLFFPSCVFFSSFDFKDKFSLFLTHGPFIQREKKKTKPKKKKKKKVNNQIKKKKSKIGGEAEGQH